MCGSPLHRNARPHSQEGHRVRGGEHGTQSHVDLTLNPGSAFSELCVLR